MLWPSDGEKSFEERLLVSTQYTNVADRHSDRQTPHDGIGRGHVSNQPTGKYVNMAVSCH